MEKDDRQLLIKVARDNGLGWKPYSLRREDDSDRNRMTMKMNLAGVCALSRRLMAIERARVLGRKPVDFGAFALELEAKRWTEGGAKVKQALRGAT